MERSVVGVRDWRRGGGASIVASLEIRRSEMTQTRRRTAGETEEEELPSSHRQSHIRSRFNRLAQRVRGDSLVREREFLIRNRK